MQACYVPLRHSVKMQFIPPGSFRYTHEIRMIDGCIHRSSTYCNHSYPNYIVQVLVLGLIPGHGNGNGPAGAQRHVGRYPTGGRPSESRRGTPRPQVAERRARRIRPSRASSLACEIEAAGHTIRRIADAPNQRSLTSRRGTALRFE